MTSLGEVLDQRSRNAADVSDAAVHRLPVEAEPAGELVAEDRLVEVARRFRLGIEHAAVERGPPLVRTLRDVGDDDVGVQ